MFHGLNQKSSETFNNFIKQRTTNVCETPIRDQIIVGTVNVNICEETLKNQWELDEFVKQGHITESGDIAASKVKTEPNLWCKQCTPRLLQGEPKKTIYLPEMWRK